MGVHSFNPQIWKVEMEGLRLRWTVKDYVPENQQERKKGASEAGGWHARTDYNFAFKNQGSKYFLSIFILRRTIW